MDQGGGCVFPRVVMRNICKRVDEFLTYNDHSINYAYDYYLTQKLDLTFFKPFMLLSSHTELISDCFKNNFYLALDMVPVFI